MKKYNEKYKKYLGKIKEWIEKINLFSFSSSRADKRFFYRQTKKIS